jgi:uncharacterized membrane protein YeaQ/YmgE (transglycosylase-associated protein family)
MLREKGDHIMGITSIFVLIVVGAIAGWLAGKIVKGFGFGLIGNIVVGIVGAFIATLILPQIGLTIGGGLLGNVVNATIGSVILLFLLRLVRKGS